jgi:hypothetical protein
VLPEGVENKRNMKDAFASIPFKLRHLPESSSVSWTLLTPSNLTPLLKTHDDHAANEDDDEQHDR